MDRVKLKEQAQKMIRGNKWYLWKPLVTFEVWTAIIAFLVGFVSYFIIYAVNGSVDDQCLKLVVNIVSGILGVVESVFMVGYSKYCLEFVRGNNKMTFKEVFKFSMNNFGKIFIVDLLIGLIIFGGCILLIIPGIIFAIGHSFYQEVCVDNIDDTMGNIISKSWQLTKGHKADLFVLMLSFIGWIILAPLTLFILYIWLVPYMIITFILAYEEIKSKK